MTGTVARADLTPEAELREVLHRSTLPIATFDLDDKRIVDANAAAREAIGIPPGGRLPQSLDEVIDPTQRQYSVDALHALAEGAIVAFESRRSLVCADGTRFDARIWVRSLHKLRVHAALIVFVRFGSDDAQDISGQLPAARLQFSGPVVVGELDLEMRLVHCSPDIRELLGEPADGLLGRPLVERIHPDDVATFLLGLGRALADAQGAAMHTRLLTANGEYAGVRLVVTPTDGATGTRLAVVLTPEAHLSADDARVGELERHLWRIGLEVQASGVVTGIQRVPDPSQVPGLAELSPRQWDIVTRLLRGERVPEIARAMFVSQSTVRNQLGTIYRKVGVHSQAELLALLRGDKVQSV
jgi:PAS domain S-box-containing protein